MEIWRMKFIHLLLICVHLVIDRSIDVACDTEFQRYDGWYNNPNHPSYGAVESNLIHQSGVGYADGVYEMPTYHLPLPGMVSDQVLRGPDGLPSQMNLTALFAFFGQFVAAEIVSTVSSGEIACPPELSILKVGRFGQCRSPADDVQQCDNSSTREALFFRSAYDHKTGRFINGPRKPVNFVTSWIDGSAIYGVMQLWSDQLRTFENGEVILPAKYHNGHEAQGIEGSLSSDGRRLSQAESFGMGHSSGGRQPFLSAFNTLFLRYHNKQADLLQKRHPEFSDEQLYQKTRRYVIAVLQNIILYEYLPALLGRSPPPYGRYQPHIDPSISVEFQAAAFRVGHSFVPSGYFVRRRLSGSESCGPSAFDAIPLCVNSDFDRRINVTIEDLIRGLTSQRTERSDAIFSDAVQNRLDAGVNQPVSQSDLPALDIMRGRDVGLADYATVRTAYKDLLRRFSFEELNTRLAAAKPDLFDRMKKLYGNFSRVDLYVGGLLEIDEPESVVGETFGKVIMEQFLRLRDGDRFWFENGLFDNKTLSEIRRTKLYHVIMAATDVEEDEIQKDVFFDTNVPCRQPYQLNATGMNIDGICGGPKHHDFFSGNEGCFISSMCVLAAIPLVCCMFAFILAHYKSMGTKSGKRTNKRISIKRMTSTRVPDAFMAEELTDYKTTRKVQITLDNDDLQIRTFSREAKLLRTIDFVSMPVKIMVRMSCDVEKNCALVVHIPKEYDLVLSFDTLESRMRFMEHFRAFLLSGIVKRYIVEVHVTTDAVLDYATTLTQRRQLLEAFFHTAFDQVLHAKQTQRKEGAGPSKATNGCANGITPFRPVRRPVPRALLPHFGGSLRISTQSPSTKAKRKRLLLATELNKQEFAEAFQLKPDSLFVNQMFALADKDQNGYISYPEFIDILALLSKGTLESKMRMLFDMYDLDGSDRLDRSELTTMIRSLLDITGDRLDDDQLEQLIHGMITQCGLQSKELLSFEDFLLLIQQHQTQLADELNNRGFGFTKCEQDINKQKNRHSDSPSPVIEKHYHNAAWTRYWKQWQYYLENNWNKVFILILFVLLSVALFMQKATEFYYQKEHTGARQVTGLGVCISRGAAISISFCFALIILAVCRNLMTILRTTWIARVIPFDEAITFHRYVAYVALFYTLVHVVGHGVNFYELSTQPPVVLKCLFDSIYFPPDFHPSVAYWLYSTIPGMTGVLLVACLSIMYVFANGLARQYIYNAFYLTHRLFVPVFALTFIHGSMQMLQEPTFYLFASGPIGLYLVDWIISLQTQCISARILKAEVLPSDVIHLRFKPRSNIRYNYHSGQYIRIACAAISDCEFHPFTITTAPHEKYMSVHIRAVGPWTRRLLGLFKELERSGDEGPAKYPKIYLDGPYGSSHQDWYKFEVVVLVGAGIGVTPHASVLKDLVHKVYHARSDITCRQVYFAWVARTHTQFEWFIDILRDVEKQDEQNLARTDIFITQLMKDFDLRTMMLYICEHQFQRLSNTSLFTGLRAKTHFGRPNFNRYLLSIKQRHAPASKIGVFTCGPKTIVRSVESACNELNQRYPDGPRIVAHHEIF